MTKYGVRVIFDSRAVSYTHLLTVLHQRHCIAKLMCDVARSHNGKSKCAHVFYPFSYIVFLRKSCVLLYIFLGCVTQAFSSPQRSSRRLKYRTAGINACLLYTSSMLDEAALSFLGMGVQPPTASLGNMLNGAQSLTVLTKQPWLWIPSGLMIVVLVIAINFIGEDVYKRQGC